MQPKPTPETKVHVIVTERPNRVYVVCQDQIHQATWKTVNPGEVGVFTISGNHGLCNAAMYAWDGHNTFTTTFAELESRSGGWGAWS